MKTVKPLRLSIMSRPYRWEGRVFLGVSALSLVSLGPEPKLFSEQDLWQLASEQIGPGNALDLGIPKRTPEWLVSGYGYTAHQENKTICAVQARVGGLVKSLTVSGDRYWLAGRMTTPQPFERMPLDWAHAFGGPDIAENPQGVGTVDEQVAGVHTRRLPNVEAPDARMVSHGQRVRPAGFGGIPPDWPQRTHMLGSDYGQDWLEHRFPGLAADADWRYFNAAAPDQQWVGAHEVPHEAAYELWNMHPTQAVLRGTLPPWRVRCFASWNKDGSDLQESSMRMTTVWMFPHVERAVLIWQGTFPIAQDDAADVQHLMAAIELPDAPRAMLHYETVLSKRLDPAQAVHAVRDSDLAPKSILGPWAAEQLSDMMARPMMRNARAGERRRHEEKRQELLRKGLDPAQYLPPPPGIEKLPEFDDLPAYSDRLQDQMEAMFTQAKAGSGQGAADAVIARVPPVAPAGAATRPRFDPNRLHDELKALRASADTLKVDAQTHGGVSDQPRLDPDETIARLREMHELERKAKSMSAEEMRESDAAHERKTDQVRQGHRYVAHLQNPAPVASSARSAKLRRRLEAADPTARRFARMNLAGVDLSRMDLRGADFSSANLEDADLRGAQLDGCNFSNAVLARARMAQASLVNAQLDHANLGGAQCDGTDFSGAHLPQTNCQKTEFRNCLFVGAQFENNNLQESIWQRCDLSRSRWTQVTFLKLALEDLVFKEAEFRQVVWIECVLTGLSFVKARMTSTSFVTTEASNGADFSQATLEVCSFAHGSAMAGAVFRGAMLKQCGLRTTCLDAADFRDAYLQNCDLSECRLVRARMDRLTAGESLFIRADLTGASLRSADLVDTNFSKADFRLADLGEANLFRADVSQAWIDSTTNLEGAYTQHAKVWPARSPEANR